MHTLPELLVAIAALAVFVWLMWPSSKTASSVPGGPDDPFIDPEDSYQIGLLVGLRGGSIPDAALMRFALQRFQEIHGRRASSRDIGTVLGLIETVE